LPVSLALGALLGFAAAPGATLDVVFLDVTFLGGVLVPHPTSVMPAHARDVYSHTRLMLLLELAFIFSPFIAARSQQHL
jgi:hypothetical protein